MSFLASIFGTAQAANIAQNQSDPVDWQVSQAMAPVDASTPAAPVDLINYNVPSGAVLHIKKICNYADDPDAFSKFKWELFIDGAPAKNFAVMRDMRGSVDNLADCDLVARRSFVVRLTSTEVTNTYTGGFIASGYTE